MHYLPCGAQRGNAAYLRRRNSFFHARGLAHLAYFNPSLCRSYAGVFERAASRGLLQRDAAGAPFLHSAFVGGSGPAGFTQEPLAQFDFTARGTQAFYGRLVREAVRAGHDGWMEDFGEGSPPQALSADGTSGTQMHNRYPTLYHCTVQRIARALPKPVVRFQRSGWTGSARCADVVWGGDPTTVWGYDGLASAVRQALSIGLSGVSRWGSDIGGYNSFGEQNRLTPELLKRWIQFGAVSGVMRTKRSGIALPSYERPQIFDPGVLPVWRRYAKLHTQLHPYLLAADRDYRRTGLPLMRHLALEWPRDRRSLGAEDQFMFGPSFLAAPVLEPGARRRRLYAPPGRWVDFWRSVRYLERTGGFVLRAAAQLRGGRRHVLRAPLAELPLLVRAGAIVPMLPADVDTLASFGRGRGLVHLRERRGRMTLLAFPRGRSSARFNEGESLGSVEGAGRWSLSLSGARRRVYELHAALGTLRRPFRPCRVSLDGRVLPRVSWRYTTGRVLRLRFAARKATLTASSCTRR
jgi:alpha-glucosidase (family GH31 glycosyl hydrolase)